MFKQEIYDMLSFPIRKSIISESLHTASLGLNRNIIYVEQLHKSKFSNLNHKFWEANALANIYTREK